MRLTLLIVGALALVAGIVWTLQGLNLLGGSVMTGEPIWAVIGLVVAEVGAVLIALGIRRGRRRSPR